MLHRRAFALIAFITLAFIAGAPRAQQAVPVDCPTIYDARGTSLGLAWSGSLSVCTRCSSHQFDNQSVARVAMEASGEVFIITVLRDDLTGTLRAPSVLAGFDGPDCTGNAYGGHPVQGGLGGPDWQDEDIGPFLPSIVVGPLDAVYLLDPSIPIAPVPGGIRSRARLHDADARLEICENLPAPALGSSRRLRKVAELAPDYQAPFRLESGPCPRPGRR